MQKKFCHSLVKLNPHHRDVKLYKTNY